MHLSKENILKLFHKKTNRPMKVAELMKQFAIPDHQRREFRAFIKSLTSEGHLIRLRGGRFGLPDEMNLVSGVLQGHPNGFGFVKPDSDDAGPDIYISKSKMSDAMHGDRVTVRIESYKKGLDKPEGRVIRILSRNTPSLVGVYETFGQDGWVVPLEEKHFHDIFVPVKNRKGAKTGQVVVADIDTYPSQHQPPIGRVTEVLGFSDDPEVEIGSILRKYGVVNEFPSKVMASAKAAARRMEDGEQENQRRDLCDRLIFTIDGETAKDFDDAVSIETTANGYSLGVHIADVSHFVPEDSPLDREALERGTSIYFPDGVVPMLPFPLSNEACSLKPGVKRLALSVEMELDQKGTVLQSEVFTSVIQSKTRFTYNEVAELLEQGDREKKYGPTLQALKDMHRLSQTLRKNRFQSGSVDFQIPEPEFTLDEKGRVTAVTASEHNAAHQLIEEFMLLANKVIARYLTDKDIPTLHRYHEKPDSEKLELFNEFILSFGLKLSSLRNVRSQDLQNLLKKVRNRPEERTINTLLLRTMKKALYSVTDSGHYGLGFKDYCHFTSPIRRYPDLATHRMVKAFLKKRKCSLRMHKHLLPHMKEIAEQSSLREVRAQKIEREINDLRAAQYMMDKVGKIFSGLIVGVTSFGFFVELSEVFIEGLVKVSSMTDDYYLYIETEHKLIGQRRHQVFKIGDQVQVKVLDVDLARREIHLGWLKTL